MNVCLRSRLLLHEITDFNLQIPANAVMFAALAGTLAGALHPREVLGAQPVVPFSLVALRRRIPT